MIERTLAIMARFTGKRPIGWLGPGLTQTLDTPEHLAAAGVKYIGDWVYDEEPTVIRTAQGPLVTLPYTLELNDIPMMLVQRHESDYLYKRTVDQFNRLYAESETRAKFVSLAIHPYISGQPHRIGVFRGDLRLRQPPRRRAALERRTDLQCGTGRSRNNGRASSK